MATTIETQKEGNPTKFPNQQHELSDPSPHTTEILKDNNTLSAHLQPQPAATNGTPKEGDSGDAESNETTGDSTGNNNSNTGSVTDTQKKIRRAERFGMPVQLSEEEKRNSRAERFGTGSGSGLHGSGLTKNLEEHKRKARAERFGLGQSLSADEGDKKKARLARFAPVSKTDSVEEDKKKARALRFSATQANGKGVEQEVAIAGKAVGGT